MSPRAELRQTEPLTVEQLLNPRGVETLVYAFRVPVVIAKYANSEKYIL